MHAPARIPCMPGNTVGLIPSFMLPAGSIVGGGPGGSMDCVAGDASLRAHVRERFGAIHCAQVLSDMARRMRRAAVDQGIAARPFPALEGWMFYMSGPLHGWALMEAVALETEEAAVVAWAMRRTMASSQRRARRSRGPGPSQPPESPTVSDPDAFLLF